MSIRLILKDLEGKDHAVPVTDDVEIRSGYLMPTRTPEKVSRLRESLGHDEDHKFYQQLAHDTAVCTVIPKGTSEGFFVALSVTEVFRRASEAHKRNEIAVELTLFGKEGLITGPVALMVQISKFKATLPPAP